MNPLEKVSELLTEAHKHSKQAKRERGIIRKLYYYLKVDKINQAIEMDIDGWHIDEFDREKRLLGMTYRGSWWFHVPLPLLSLKAKKLIASKPIHHWLGSVDDENQPAGTNSKNIQSI